MGLSYDPLKLVEGLFSQGPDTIFFLNILKTRLDDNVARGARVKALAIGSRNKFVLEPLTKVLEAALD